MLLDKYGFVTTLRVVSTFPTSSEVSISKMLATATILATLLLCSYMRSANTCFASGHWFSSSPVHHLFSSSDPVSIQLPDLPAANPPTHSFSSQPFSSYKPPTFSNRSDFLCQPSISLAIALFSTSHQRSALCFSLSSTSVRSSAPSVLGISPTRYIFRTSSPSLPLVPPSQSSCSGDLRERFRDWLFSLWCTVCSLVGTAPSGRA